MHYPPFTEKLIFATPYGKLSNKSVVRLTLIKKSCQDLRTDISPADFSLRIRQLLYLYKMLLTFPGSYLALSLFQKAVLSHSCFVFRLDNRWKLLHQNPWIVSVTPCCVKTVHCSTQKNNNNNNILHCERNYFCSVFEFLVFENWTDGLCLVIVSACIPLLLILYHLTCSPSGGRDCCSSVFPNRSSSSSAEFPGVDPDESGWECEGGSGLRSRLGAAGMSVSMLSEDCR